MAFTAREIVQRLHDNGYLDSGYRNTGGGVYNVTFEPLCQHGRVLGEVRASDGGDWTASDIDTPADEVTVYAVSPDGDTVADVVAVDVDTVTGLFEGFSVLLERSCPQCSGERVADTVRDQARALLERFDANYRALQEFEADPGIREKYVDGARWDCEEMVWELAEALRTVLKGGE